MTARTVGWFSCGAASAVTVTLEKPDVIVYCVTGSEHPDNDRFMRDMEVWLGKKVTIIKSDKYKDTWDVWEKRGYLAGIKGAPCTGELKVKPRLAFQRPDDIHIFGYTNDLRDITRSKALIENWPDLTFKFPLIERQINKAACLSILASAGVQVPLTYALGFPNANCLPCVKATSPAYWALIRQEFPAEFNRMVKLSRKLGVRLTRIKNERIFIDEIPLDYPTTDPIAPGCDLLCSLAEQELTGDTS